MLCERENLCGYFTINLVIIMLGDWLELAYPDGQ
jgi:hypothetical protein